MKFASWMKKASSEEIRKLAKRVGCNYLYLYQVAKGSCSAGLAKKIEQCTKKLTPERVVKKNELRPDIWSKGE